MKLAKFSVVDFSKLMRLFVLGSLLMVVSTPFMRTWAANITVTNVAEFQTALDVAALNGANDTIHVAAGIYIPATTLTFSSWENHSLTISGAGMGSTILDGNSAIQLFYLITSESGAHLTLQNMTFRNGSSASDGGALHIETTSAAITIQYSEFADNTAQTLGGGANALSASGVISVDNCVFRRNSGIDDAGGLNAGNSSGLISLTHSLFEENIVPGVHPGVPAKDGGGAILYIDGEGQIVMTGNTFNRNAAADGGGGCMTYLLGSGVTLTIDSNTFTENIAQLDGGGCFTRINDNGTITYNNNSFSGNSTITAGGAGTMIHLNAGILNYSGNTYADNIAGEDGGGAWMWIGEGTMSVTNNTFTDNQTVSNGGGALIANDQGTITLARNTFDSNTAGNVGGGLSYATGNGTLILSHNTYYANHASEGGGIYFYFDLSDAQTTIFNNILRNDIPQAIAMSGATTTTVTYSDIENGSGEDWFGVGCIDEDPLWANPANGNFQLTWSGFPVIDNTKSPCIDAGDPFSPFDPDNTAADMGARYFHQGVLNAFSLTMPPDNSLVTVLTPQLQWNHALATETENVDYSLYYCRNIAFDSAQAVCIPNITTNSYTFSGGLTDTSSYYWRILAKIGSTQRKWSAETWKFSIKTDTIPPVFSNWIKNPNDLTEETAGAFQVQVTITDNGVGLGDSIPKISYKIGNNAYSEWFPLAQLSSSSDRNFSLLTTSTGQWQYDIPEPATGWNSFRGDTLYYRVLSSDAYTNTRTSPEQKEWINRVLRPPLIAELPQIMLDEDIRDTVYFKDWFDYISDNHDADSQLTCALNSANLGLKPITAGYELTPPADWFGLDTMQLIVTNLDNLADTGSILVRVSSINDCPELMNLPDSIYFRQDSACSLKLWDYASDIETPDSLLIYEFNVGNDSIGYNFNPGTGIVQIMSNGFSGHTTWVITVKDDSNATVSDTIALTVYSVTSILENENGKPFALELYQNCPNPFNLNTIFEYDIPKPTLVKLSIYDIEGKCVRKLINQIQSPGKYYIKWNGQGEHGDNIGTGIYFYQLMCEGRTITRKMLMIK